MLFLFKRNLVLIIVTYNKEQPIMNKKWEGYCCSRTFINITCKPDPPLENLKVDIFDTIYNN